VVKTFVMEKDGKVFTFSFNRPSESAMQRKFMKVDDFLTKLNHTLKILQERHRSYLSRVDAEIENIKAKIKDCENQLLILHSPEFQKWLDDQREEEVLAYAKAEDFLMNYIGLEAYAELMEKDELVFESITHEIFKITRFGLVYKQNELKQFHPVCMIKPKQLPLPDFIVSALTTLKENPNLWRR